MHFVVDTNIPKVASGQSPQADVECVNACVQALLEITRSGLLLLDDQEEIFQEYLAGLGLRGQPGMGEKFVKWVANHRYDETRCVLVKITALGSSSWRSHDEFPDIESLRAFDRSDHKFVAVALAFGRPNEILNAVDSDWHEFREPLRSVGIRVRELCATRPKSKRRKR